MLFHFLVQCVSVQYFSKLRLCDKIGIAIDFFFLLHPFLQECYAVKNDM